MNKHVISLLQVYGFCDNVTNENQRHNPDAPNEQNELCDGRSAWEVLRTLADFQGTVL